jgi:hypothetical protein
MPEGDAELPDEGLPDEQDDDDDCSPADIWRARTEDLGDNPQSR